MDFSRSCYRTQWRFFFDSPENGPSPVYTVRWYFAKEGAQPLPFQHCWGNTLWLDEWAKNDCPIGEIPYVPNHTWSNGRTLAGAPGDHWCGDEIDFQQPFEWDPDLPTVARNAEGLAACCNARSSQARVLASIGGVDGGLGRSGKFVVTNGYLVLNKPARNSVNLVLEGRAGYAVGSRVLAVPPLERAGGLALGSLGLPDGKLVLSPGVGLPDGRLVLSGPDAPSGYLELSGVPGTEFVFTSPGDYPVTIPADWNSIRIEVIGAGGSGAVGYGSVFNPTFDGTNGGGGAGGGYAFTSALPVSPGDTLSVHVGAGGVGYGLTAPGAGTPGDSSYVIYDPTGDDTTAGGGMGGDTNNTFGLGALGGVPVGSMVDGGNNGGDCAVGPSLGDGTGAPVGGNGGGGGSDVSGAGGSGGTTSSSTGAAGGSSGDGGVGGSGGSWSGSVAGSGTNGGYPGGGGGGGASSDGLSPGGSPGNGANGWVRITKVS